jgi:hypothetical protein
MRVSFQSHRLLGLLVLFTLLRTRLSFSLIKVEVLPVDLPIQANVSAIVRVTLCMVGTLQRGQQM